MQFIALYGKIENKQCIFNLGGGKVIEKKNDLAVCHINPFSYILYYRLLVLPLQSSYGNTDHNNAY